MRQNLATQAHLLTTYVIIVLYIMHIRLTILFLPILVCLLYWQLGTLGYDIYRMYILWRKLDE
jgi:hypothetical protein